MTGDTSYPRQRQHFDTFPLSHLHLTVDKSVDTLVNGFGKVLTPLSTVVSTVKSASALGKPLNR
jgi:hypothetical protein